MKRKYQKMNLLEEKNLDFKEGKIMQEEFFPFEGWGGSEVLAVPHFALVIDASTGFRRQ